jgi:hypothetical protein
VLGDLHGPAVIVTIVGEPYLTAIRDALNEALPQ